MRSLLIICVLLFSTVFTARAQYTICGKIEYERKVNIHALIDEDDNTWFKQMEPQLPKFNSAFFDLVFDTSGSIYKPGREVEATPIKVYDGPSAPENIVYTDFRSGKVNALKTVFEEKFRVEDTMRKIEWQEKDELRTIANYKCRKAVGRICDSVYVVAYYTEDIMVSGGPEMFGGLPGMILELAVPRLHTTWVATKVAAYVPTEKDFEMPAKGKKVNQQKLYETLKESLEDWGKSAARNIWWAIL